MTGPALVVLRPGVLLSEGMTGKGIGTCRGRAQPHRRGASGVLGRFLSWSFLWFPRTLASPW